VIPDPLALTAHPEKLDLDAFDCGEESLNQWLSQRAPAAESRTARTYVIADGRAVMGYYCLSAGAVDRSVWPSALRRNAPDPIPIILLGRLAVNRASQGKGVSRVLMLHAMRQSHLATRIVGARALVVHALHDHVARFYESLGFRPFASLTLALFMLFETVARTLVSLGDQPH
jgi:GNAT superfamily N-acetyltransferase